MFTVSKVHCPLRQPTENRALMRKCERRMIATAAKTRICRFQAASPNRVVMMLPLWPGRRHVCSIVNSKRPMAGLRRTTLYSTPIEYGDDSRIIASRKNRRQEKRSLSSWLPSLSLELPSIWGASGYLLQSIHTTTGLPYWACFATLSVGVRTLLIPVVLHGAHTAARFAQIAPDVQFQLALFQKDLQTYRTAQASARQVAFLLRTNMKTLSATYKLHRVNPLSILASPLIQMPIFWYISVDMRKIVNGLDPQLAQRLVESGIGWVPDLTEADPYFGLPVLAGIMLYANMEVALGRRTMAGTAASKADTAVLLKDVFQSLAVFMPCFTSHMPAGIQIYIVTSFAFTMVQSVALRTEPVRALVGLPMMQAAPIQANAAGTSVTTTGRFTTQMMELKLLEQKAKELRGNGPVLGGHGVLMHGWQVSFAGTRRPSTIDVSTTTNAATTSTTGSTTSPIATPFRIEPYATAWPAHAVPAASSASSPNLAQSTSTLNVSANGALMPQQPLHRFTASTPFVHGISAPEWQLATPEQPLSNDSTKDLPEAVATITANPSESDGAAAAAHGTRECMPHFDDTVMEKANRGEPPRRPIQFVDSSPTLASTRNSSDRPVVVRKPQRKGKRPRK